MNDTFLFLVGIFALIGSIDHALNNRFGLGEQFAEGFLCMGPTALSMVGIICIIPLVHTVIAPIVNPISHFFGFDASIFGALLANNMGGYALAMELCENTKYGLFSGLIVSSMLGATLVYVIPVGLGIVKKELHNAFAKGTMIGLITIPIGSLVGGLLMGLSFVECFYNLIPVIIISLLIIIGFKINEAFVMKCFLIFAKGLNLFFTLSLGLVAFQSITKIQLFSTLEDIYVGLEVVMEMGVVQLGTLPLIAFIQKILDKPFNKIGKYLNISSIATTGLMACTINAISVFTMMNRMNEREVLIVNSFMVSAIAALTAHLSFTLSYNASLVVPVLVAKLISAIFAVLLALLICKRESYK